MVAEIVSAFPSITWNMVLNEMDATNVLAYFHLARFAKHGISVPKIFKDKETIQGAMKNEDFRKHYRHDPVKGWVRLDG
jgi:hypothetical protein